MELWPARESSTAIVRATINDAFRRLWDPRPASSLSTSSGKGIFQPGVNLEDCLKTAQVLHRFLLSSKVAAVSLWKTMALTTALSCSGVTWQTASMVKQMAFPRLWRPKKRLHSQHSDSGPMLTVQNRSNYKTSFRANVSAKPPCGAHATMSYLLALKSWIQVVKYSGNLLEAHAAPNPRRCRATMSYKQMRAVGALQSSQWMQQNRTNDV